MLKYLPGNQTIKLVAATVGVTLANNAVANYVLSADTKRANLMAVTEQWKKDNYPNGYGGKTS